MKTVSRRDLLKTSMMVPAGVAAAQGLGPMGSGLHQDTLNSEPSRSRRLAKLRIPEGGRERLLLDFEWRFHFGNADDPTKDFDFGSGRTGNFQKTGNFLPAGALAYDDGDWKPVNLPHDWAVELPFQNDPALASKGYYPLGRTYPTTSVGWYRRVFDLPAGDEGKRLTLEFDGSYRETMVVLNGFFIGTHSGGYDPFSFDVTDFANPVAETFCWFASMRP
jgi:beta-galactosidase